MGQITEVGNASAPQNPESQKVGAISYVEKVAREIVAGFFWLYVLVKLFVFDIDVFLIDEFVPRYAWLLNYKFFILIGLIAVVWLITKNKHIAVWTFYILCYPAIVLLWKIPSFVYKQQSWIVAFAFVNAVISFFISLKYIFITTAFLLISLAIIFSSSDKILLWPAIVVLLVLLTMVYVYRFILVFKPSRIFQVHIKLFSGIRKHGAPTFALDETIKSLPVARLDQKQLDKRTTNLQMSVMFNRLCLFAAKKLRQYQTSGFHAISGIVTILLLFVLTMFVFGAINYGLYKIDISLFDLSTSATFFIFVYYSFNTLIFNSIKEVVPTMAISQTVFMIESFFALLLLAIFGSILFSVRSQRHSEELNEAIARIEDEGASMEQFIRDEYNLNNIAEAIIELERLKAGFVSFIYKMSEGLK